MELLPLFIAVIPLLIALYKTEWGIWAFLFMIPGYAVRVSVGPAEISMVEIAAVLLAVRLAAEIVCARFHIHSSARCSRCEKLALTALTKKPRLLAIRSLDMLSFSTSFGNFKHFLRRGGRMNAEARSWHSWLLSVGIFLFVLGLFISLTQSNDVVASLGIIRGWVLVPIIFAFLFGAWMRAFGVPVRFFVSAFVVSGIVVAITAPFWDNAWGGGRLHGFYESPNYLAMYLAPLLPLIAWYAKEYWHKNIVRYVILGGFAVVLLAVLFSLSRGAWIGVLGGGFFAIPLFGRSWLRRNWGVGVFGVSALTALVVAALAFSPLYALLQGALHSRLGIWEAAYEMLVQSPLWGVGAGMFQTAFMVKKHFVLYPVPVEVALHPHNIFLTTWLYGGLLGLVGFLGILLAVGRTLYTNIKSNKNAAFHGALALSFIIILIHGLTDTTYWKNDLAFMWWILIFLSRNSLNNHKKEELL